MGAQHGRIIEDEAVVCARWGMGERGWEGRGWEERVGREGMGGEGGADQRRTTVHLLNHKPQNKIKQLTGMQQRNRHEQLYGTTTLL